jgi:hypothetical protein
MIAAGSIGAPGFARNSNLAKLGALFFWVAVLCPETDQALARKSPATYFHLLRRPPHPDEGLPLEFPPFFQVPFSTNCNKISLENRSSTARIISSSEELHETMSAVSNVGHSVGCPSPGGSRTAENPV